MQVKDYVPGGYNAATLAKAHETDLGRIILHAIAFEQARVGREIDRKPRVNTEDVRDDVRYKLGRKAAIVFVRDLFILARKELGDVTAEAIDPLDFDDDVT